MPLNDFKGIIRRNKESVFTYPIAIMLTIENWGLPKAKIGDT